MKLLSTSVMSRRALGIAASVVAVVAVGACVPESPPSTTAPGTTATLTDATLEWSMSKELNNAAFAPGQVNYWNASTTPATSAANYLATDGDVTVLKKSSTGAYVPIGSNSSVSWANKNRNGDGTVVTTGNSSFLDQKLRLTGGNGTVNTTTGVATIQWSGALTVNFYGTYVPFSLSNLKLTVNGSGKGTLSATASGVAKDMNDPEAPPVVLPTSSVVLAEIPNVYASGSKSTGFANAATAYLGTAVTIAGEHSPQAPKVAGNAAYWGAWPQSFVNFQLATNLSSYWYTSGLTSTDPLKVQDPISVAFNLPG